MEAQRRQRPGREIQRRAQVDIVSRRPRAIERHGFVISARRRVLRYARSFANFHLALRPGDDHTAHGCLSPCDPLAQRIQKRNAPLRRVRIQIGRVHRHCPQPSADAAFDLTEFDQYRVNLLADLIDKLQPGIMQLLRRHVCRRVELQRIAIIRFTILQRPHTRISGRLGQQPLEQLHQRRVFRLQRPADLIGCALHKLGDVVLGNVRDLRQLLDEIDDQRMLARNTGCQLPRLVERALHDRAGRDDASGDINFEAPALVAKRFVHVVQPRQPVFRVGARADRGVQRHELDEVGERAISESDQIRAGPAQPVHAMAVRFDRRCVAQDLDRGIVSALGFPAQRPAIDPLQLIKQIEPRRPRPFGHGHGTVVEQGMIAFSERLDRKAQGVGFLRRAVHFRMTESLHEGREVGVGAHRRR